MSMISVTAEQEIEYKEFQDILEGVEDYRAAKSLIVNHVLKTYPEHSEEDKLGLVFSLTWWWHTQKVTKMFNR